jgi:hypothetical protein
MNVGVIRSRICKHACFFLAIDSAQPDPGDK